MQIKLKLTAKITGDSPNTWKLNNMLLNNPWSNKSLKGIKTLFQTKQKRKYDTAKFVGCS